MSTNTMSSNAFDLGGEGNSFAFDTVGASVTGRITDIEQVQQTDMQTGQPAVWDDGKPKMMVRVELQTEIRDTPFDDGKRSVYLRGPRKPESKSSMAAVLAAVMAATGARAIARGGTLTLTYSGDGEPSRKGYNAPKQYEASYRAPLVDLGGGEPEAGAQPATTTAPTPDSDEVPAGFTADQWAAMPEATKAAIRAAQQ
ncbi:hypothetical protein [Gordonia sp. N1V]|uniref:hypothetical protein n=1 Tax=Gordonia sp. N1V TaxID=3034163 RepID=UPI0023E24B56|nr:hypothetical protein [Gordonia sp. N1V]MDF3280453.1 hypothetical protein [Gordonia sp. N1V]